MNNLMFNFAQFFNNVFAGRMPALAWGIAWGVLILGAIAALIVLLVVVLPKKKAKQKAERERKMMEAQRAKERIIREKREEQKRIAEERRAAARARQQAQEQAEEPKAEEVKEEPVVEEKVEEEKAEQPAPVEEAPVEEPKVEEPVVEEKVEEAKDEQPAPVEEAPVEEPKAEEPKVEEVKEEPKAEKPAKKEKAPAKKKEATSKAKKTQPKAKAEKKTAEKKPVEKKKAQPKVAPVVVAEKKEEKPAEKKPSKKAVGKWTVEIKSENEYMAKLYANNGECMLSSEIYSSEEGARSGISTIVKAVANGKFITYQDKNANHYFKLKTTGNRLLCVGEIYKSLEQCLKAVESVKRLAGVSPIIAELVQGQRYIDYTPVANPTYEAKKGTRGKWVVEETKDGKWTAKLFASNGQIMLSTEEVASKKTAENSMASVKKNSADGNFIVDKDKFGRFYYKLRNAQKSVICIGEAYDKLDSCTSALESVRRFAATAVYGDEE